MRYDELEQRERGPTARDHGKTRATPWLTLTVVGLVAVGIHTFSLLASHSWVYPDSIDYVILASGIADRGDLANELFLIRPPGYPLLLAGLFVIFQSASPFALLALQHMLAAATALLTGGIAWTLTRRGTVACLAGVFSGLSLQSLAYANLVLTETTYSFLLAAVLFAFVRYVMGGHMRTLVIGSGLSGVAYLVKPVGVYLLSTSLLALILRRLRDAQRGVPISQGSSSPPPPEEVGHPVFRGPRRPRRLKPAAQIRHAGARILSRAVIASVLPALIVIAPWKIASGLMHASDDTNRCLDYVLYLRALEFDGLDSNKSPALGEIKDTVALAINRGVLPADADFRDRATVIRAFEAAKGIPFAESSIVMGRAARDVMLEHATTIGVNTFRYAAWMLLAPDPVYRFQPGGVPGIDGKRDVDAVTYDIGTYAFGPGSWESTLAAYRHYLPLQTNARGASPAWTQWATAFHDHIDTAPPMIGIADSPYSEWVLLCLVGLMLTLFTQQRAGWFLLLCVLGAHVLISAFLGGPQTRYALPVQPILKLGGAWFLVEIVRCAVLSLRTLMQLPARTAETQSVHRAS